MAKAKTFVFIVRSKDENGQYGRYTKQVDAANVNLAWQIVVRNLLSAGLLPYVIQIALEER